MEREFYKLRNELSVSLGHKSTTEATIDETWEIFQVWMGMEMTISFISRKQTTPIFITGTPTTQYLPHA